MIDQHVEYEFLLAFAADELPPDNAQAVAAHIEICAACSNVVRRYKLISFVMRTDDSREPPPATIARAQAIFAQQRPARSVWGQGFQLSKLTLSPHQFARAFVLVAFILANLVLYGGIGIVAVSAQESIPGDSFYQAKLNIESIQLVATWDTGDKVLRHVEFADSRTNETVALVALQRLAEIPSTLTLYEREVNLIQFTFSLLMKENLKRAQALGPRIEATLTRQISTLSNLRDTIGETLRPALDHAITLGDTQRMTVNALFQPQPTPVPSIQAPRLGEPTLTRVVGSAEPKTATVPAALRTNTLVLPVTTKPAASTSSGSLPTKPGVVPSIKPSTPTIIPFTLTPSVELCQATSQPKPSGIINSVTMAEGVQQPFGEPINPIEEFTPKQTVYAVVSIQNAPSNTKFKARWCVTNVGQAERPNTKLSEAELLTDRTRNIHFYLASPAGLAVGTYRVEIYVNGVLDSVRQFRVK